MKLQTLHRIGSELSSPRRQREILADPDRVAGGTFGQSIAAAGREPLRAGGIRILQVNLGKLCNQTCAHCHVDAGPDRRESMTRGTAENVLDFLERSAAGTLDITGGAPEMNPVFRFLVEGARALGRHTIDRCNLTILLAPGFRDLPEFLAQNQVEVIASLPCYLEDNCDAQRGEGVFQESLQALRILNGLGYGKENSPLRLNLVYNPVGWGLPPDQAGLESDYRRHLGERYGIVFHRLFTLANMPISRFLDDLLRQGQYENYMRRLIDAFNPATLDGLMCCDTLSVDWRGCLFDCDFNQMLDLPVDPAAGRHVADADPARLWGRSIRTANHCFGCTAGCGSTCQGSVV